MTRQLTTLNLDNFLKNAIGMHEMISRVEHANSGNYPPYNIIAKDENNFVIELAIAGFKEDEIDINVANGQLVIDGDLSRRAVEEEALHYHHKGISSRSFRRSFSLAEYVEVQGATIEDGILKISLERIVPEKLKPRKIEIK